MRDLQWRCGDCGSRVVFEKKMGGGFIHCNCMGSQTIRLFKMKPVTNEAGIEELAMVKRKKGFKMVSSAIDRISASRRGLTEFEHCPVCKQIIGQFPQKLLKD